jgi:hypothetical protein
MVRPIPTFWGTRLKAAIKSAATPGAFEVIPRLVAHFEGRVWIISKCGESTQRKTLAWLDHHDFYARTGLPKRNVRFCRQRADNAIHCRKLGITHMIDDRLDVHRAIRKIVPHRYLFGPQQGEIPPWIIYTRTGPPWPPTSSADQANSPGTLRFSLMP